MNIFLSRLSPNTTLSELEKTAHSLLSKKIHIPFTEPATLRNCKIMKIKDAHGGVEFHGLLNINRPVQGSGSLNLAALKKFITNLYCLTNTSPATLLGNLTITAKPTIGAPL
ncbi:MAG: hypothetical protein AXW16_04085 [Cycloclasticus sp. Phe_18]|nr:MAG: hypothetical protein AXW16_04085 [Cycloclasticus sp. Phe_18]